MDNISVVVSYAALKSSYIYICILQYTSKLFELVILLHPTVLLGAYIKNEILVNDICLFIQTLFLLILKFFTHH